MTQRPRLLLIDDGERHAELCHALLRQYDYATRCQLAGPCWTCEHRAGCQLTHAHDWGEAQQALASQSGIDLVLLDVAFDVSDERLLLRGDGDRERSRRLQGLEILRRLRQRWPRLPVLLMSSLEALRLEEEAPELPADEFVVLAGDLSFDARALGALIERVLSRRPSPAAEEDGEDFYWGHGSAMAEIRQNVLALSRTSLPMLVLGETGTGKSALARRVIHRVSGRPGPFVQLDLSTVPASLVASELFGTVSGAFSGAVERAGRFEQADGGTLFLDEIGNLPLEAQRTLLLALQSGRVTRLGEGKERQVDVKLVAATNADLEQLVRRGEFREDLYARLNPAARISLPSLRDRAEDLMELARRSLVAAFENPTDLALLRSYMAAAELSGPADVSLAVGASEPPRHGLRFVLAESSVSALQAHRWPGNLRQLSFLLTSSALFAVSDGLRALEEGRAARGPAARLMPLSPSAVAQLLDMSRVSNAQASQSVPLVVAPKPAAALRDVMRQVERQMLERLHKESAGDFAAIAARLLSGDPQTNARRVRLRFNQLGLRARRHQK